MTNWREMPSLSALRAFEAAARLESLSGAARELNVTHAAIAQHVRALEDRFATPLLRRSGRGMVTTEAGHALARGLTEGFDVIAATVAELKSRSECRPLRLSLTPSFAENWLMPRIGGFWSSHPEIRLELVPGHELVDLRRDGFDMAVRYGRGGWTGVESEILVPANHALVAAPQLARKIGTPSPEAMGAQHWLLEKGRREERLWAAALNFDLSSARVSEFDTNTLVLQAVLAGHGVSIIPKAIVMREVELGRLAILREEEASPLAYHLLTRPGPRSPALASFIRWIKSAT